MTFDLEERLEAAKDSIPWQNYQITRHPNRPRSLYYIENVFDSFIEDHGDGDSSDDQTIIGGKASLNGIEFIVIGQQKPENKEAIALRNSGMIKPAGYKKAIRLMKRAEREHLPIITLIDTVGGESRDEAATNLQSWRIAESMAVMSGILAPIYSIIIGEGGSGGAQALEVADKIFMLKHAVNSVISPEGCASILWGIKEWRDHLEEARTRSIKYAPLAAELLQATAYQLKKYSIITDIIPEPEGGAHNDPLAMAHTIKKFLLTEFALPIYEGLPNLKEVWDLDGKDWRKVTRKIQQERYKKWRAMGEQEWRSHHGPIPTKTYSGKHKKMEKTREVASGWIAGLKEAYHEHKKEKQKTETHCDPNPKADGNCGQWINTKRLEQNFKVCPNSNCQHHFRMSIEDWIRYLADDGKDHEFNKNIMRVDAFGWEDHKGKYSERLMDAMHKSHRKSGLYTGQIKINDASVILTISDPRFFGGSFTSAEGEKYVRAVERANKKKMPLISIVQSGGIGMEGSFIALTQMAKVNAALHRLKEKGGLIISVLGKPSTGGVLASYGTYGNRIYALPDAFISFAGPRVTGPFAGSLDESLLTPESVLKYGGINAIVPRKDLKEVLNGDIQTFLRYKK